MALAMPQDELLHRYLSENEAACPACGYSLSNLKAGTCPECGSQLRLALAEDHALPTLPLRIVLWWSLAVNLIMIASFVAIVWSMFEVLMEMHRDLGMAAPSFPRFLLASLVEDLYGILTVAMLIAAFVSAYFLIRLSNAHRRRQSVRRLRAITIGLLAFNLLAISLQAFA
jgi:hypothetical protein